MAMHVFGVVLFALCLQVPEAQQDDARAIADACIKSINSIESVRTGGQNYLPGEKVDETVDVTADGHLIINDFGFTWERHKRRLAIEGRFYAAANGSGGYTKYKAAFDGEEFKTFGPQANSGQILPVGPALYKAHHIATLLGHNVIEHPLRDITELLSSSRVKLVVDAEAAGELAQQDVYLLEVPYKQSEGEPHERPFLLKVWIDFRNNYLPRKIECINLSTGTIHTRVTVDKFHTLKDGVVIPVAGFFGMFDVTIYVPDGYKFKELLDMTEDKRKEVGAVNLPLRIGTGLGILLSTHDIDVNFAVDNKMFDLEFPPGAVVYDDINKISLQVAPDGTLVERDLLEKKIHPLAPSASTSHQLEGSIPEKDVLPLSPNASATYQSFNFKTVLIVVSVVSIVFISGFSFGCYWSRRK